MNYTSIHITSFFRETIKEHLVVLTSLFTILLGVAGCQENNVIKVIPDKQVSKKEVFLRPNEGKWYYNDQPFSGFLVVYHENGNLAERVGYYKGKKEGLAQKWYVEGTLQKKSTYIENRLEGKVTSWWPNGIINAESNFINGKDMGYRKNGTQMVNYQGKQIVLMELKRACNKPG